MEAHRMTPAILGLSCLIGGLVVGFMWGKIGGQG